MFAWTYTVSMSTPATFVLGIVVLVLVWFLYQVSHRPY